MATLKTSAEVTALLDTLNSTGKTSFKTNQAGEFLLALQNDVRFPGRNYKFDYTQRGEITLVEGPHA